jgi:cell division protein FtsW (lipid II flippase)
MLNLRPLAPADLLPLFASIPALVLGVLTMRQLGVRPSAWSMNLAACAVGLLLFGVLRYSSWPATRSAWYLATAGSIAAILSTFAFDGLDGVHRWVSVGGFGLHVSAIVAPVIIACVATAPGPYLAIVSVAATAILLALQPDAAQALSLAAGCGVILASDPRLGLRAKTGGLAVLLVCSIVSLVRPDPLQPVRHVEGIFEVVSAKGPAWALLAAVALLLLSVPFFVTWARRRDPAALALGVYVAMVTIAPMWGTFPVPVMGYGVSPILGYFIALGLSARPARSGSDAVNRASS